MVSKSQLSTETIEYPKKMLRLGQAVKCGVIVWDKTWDWISLSLVPMGRRESSTQVLQLGKKYIATTVVRIFDNWANFPKSYEGFKSSSVMWK